MNDSVTKADAGQQPDDGQQPEPAAGSLADLVVATERVSIRSAFPPATLVKMAVMAALFVALNYWQFPRLVGIWRHSPNWSHGFVIPLFSLYLLYARRDELFAARRRTFLPGLPLMIISILFIVVSFAFIRTLWLCNLGMIALLLSMVLYLAGPEVIRITWLPILFLVFAMPIPEMLYSEIALPLQNLAATISTMTLQAMGAKIEVSASALTITSISGQIHHLTVAEACSGVRSLMAFLALGVAWAYLERRPMWQRVVLVIFAVPIAILCNVLRVTITCAMFVYDKPELGQNFMHEFTGMLMLIPALALFWGLGKLLDHLFVEVDVDTDGEQDKPASQEGKRA